MAHLHLQVLVYRFNSIAEDYIQRVNWIAEPALVPMRNLKRTIDTMCGKQRFQSCRSLVFDDPVVEKDILHFITPVNCCGRILFNSETLIPHFVQYHADERMDRGTTRLVVLLNLYVQLVNHILVLYDNNYERVDQRTVEHLRKAYGTIGIILLKPVRIDAISVGMFVPTGYIKWKLIFDYTCAPCSNAGIDRCRFCGSIAWIKFFSHSLAVNAIRHLESRMHAGSIRGLPKDRVVIPEQEINNNPQWSEASLYLLRVREQELFKMCVIGLEIEQSTPYDAAIAYVTSHLSRLLGGLTVKAFGSRVTGTATHDSDLDLNIKSRSGQKDKTAYNKAIAWANANKPEVEVLKNIPEGPLVIRIDVVPLKMVLDLTFASSYVVANSQLIKYYFGLQPLARKMFFLLKEWKRRIDFSPKFHHHVLTMLIIFFMQYEHYLPPICSLIIGPPILNDAYNTNFDRSAAALPTPQSLLKLTKDFFGYWAQFDWTRNGICVFDAAVKPKESFHFATGRVSTPPMMASDYFDQSRNCAANIQIGDYRKFVRSCQEAAKILELKHAF